MIKLITILNQVTANLYSAFFYSPLKNGDEESYFFINPSETFALNKVDDSETFLARIDEIRNGKRFGYTMLPYELGFMFEHRLKGMITKRDEASIKQNSLIVTFDKKDVQRIKTSDIDFSGINEQKMVIRNFHLKQSKKVCINNIGEIKKQIAEGETYQINLTDKADFQFTGMIEQLFYRLMVAQSAEYSCFINHPQLYLLSASPELFFSLERRKITAKPMKGTSPRGKNFFEDATEKKKLFLSEKNRAENLMIVDLLRNDLGKISRQNSVVVKNLFAIETYESLLQMTSTIKSALNKKHNLSALVKNIFPCGSITGAPKISSMEIIHRIEKTPRGIYTGSIGLLLPEKSIFNVAIRTLEVNKNKSAGKIGLGAGITWGSDADEEYKEIISKGRFLTQPAREFELFTSFLFENGKPFLLNEHFKRLKKTSDYFLFYFDRTKISSELEKCFDSLDKHKQYKIRVALNKFGKIIVTKTELRGTLRACKQNKVNIIISQKKIDSNNRFQYFKTTNRALYDLELSRCKRKGFAEVLFLNEKNNVAEGSFTNIFIFTDGCWRTPPVSAGILNGIYRNYFIKKHGALEQEITVKDFSTCTKVILTNSVRKIINVQQIVWNGNIIFKLE